MTQLAAEERAVLVEDMKSFDEQMPSIGVFCYDPKSQSLYGVCKKELTPREADEAFEKGEMVIDYPYPCNQIMANEFCGRVTWAINKFIVLVGHWTEPIQEKLIELLEKEFSLPYFELKYDGNNQYC